MTLQELKKRFTPDDFDSAVVLLRAVMLHCQYNRVDGSKYIKSLHQVTDFLTVLSGKIRDINIRL